MQLHPKQVVNLGYLFLLTLGISLLAHAQSGTSSAISGTVTDATGALVPNAAVTATETNTKAVRTGMTDANGHYLFSQVNPGTYQVTVQASGFAGASSEPTPVEVGRNVALNFSLHPASSSQTIEVSAQQGLLSLDNPNTTTTMSAETIKNLPNPGQDLTYLAQFAQGALMNTAGSSSDAKAAGGYGNVEFNGLPATSNGYILDGYDSNDPWLGLNIGLSTNLVIGLDAVQEATVNTNSFSVDQGRYAVAQVNFITKSGTNAFHGEVSELWNGSLLNAENYFLHANDTLGSIAQKPRDVVNEFGVSMGGPILRNKLFFFAHYEGIRIALPIVTPTTLPTPDYQQYVLGQLSTADTIRSPGPTFPAQPAEIPFYKNMFSLLPAPGGSPVAITACPLDASGTILPAPPSGTLLDGSGCATQQQRSLNNSDSENLIVLKNRPHNQRQRQRLVSLPEGLRPAGGMDRSDQLNLQLLFAAAAAHPGRGIYASLQLRPRQSVQSRSKLVLQHLRAEQLLAGAADVPHRARPEWRQRALHCNRRPEQYVPAGAQGDAMADQRQPDLDTRPAHLALRYQHAPRRHQRLRPRGRHRAHRHLQRSGEFTYGAAYTAQQSYPISLKERVTAGNLEYLCNGYLQAFAQGNPYLRYARDLDY
jgi:hypothetical protein